MHDTTARAQLTKHAALANAELGRRIIPLIVGGGEQTPRNQSFHGPVDVKQAQLWVVFGRLGCLQREHATAGCLNTLGVDVRDRVREAREAPGDLLDGRLGAAVKCLGIIEHLKASCSRQVLVRFGRLLVDRRRAGIVGRSQFRCQSSGGEAALRIPSPSLWHGYLSPNYLQAKKRE
jgi:hypothetical protein